MGLQSRNLMRTIRCPTVVVVVGCVLAPSFSDLLLVEGALTSLRRTPKGATELVRNRPANRRLPKRSGSHGGYGGSSNYLGCLGLSSDELKYSWIFSSEAPSCQYTHHTNCGYSSSASDKDDCSSNENKNNDSSSSYIDESASTSYSKDQEDSASSSGTSNSNTGETGTSGQTNQGGTNSGSSTSQTYNSSSKQNNHTSSNKQNYSSNKQNGNKYKNQNNGGSTDQVVTNQNFGNGGSNGSNSNANGSYNNQSYDPYRDFNIERCDTYQNLWLWDLSLSCGGESNASSCECQFAEELEETGHLSCSDMSRCPSECPICVTCFRLINCTNAVERNVHGLQASSNAVVVVGGAVGLLMLYFYYNAHDKRKGTSGEMGKYLMNDEPPIISTESQEENTSEPQVWLAPVLPMTNHFEQQPYQVTLEEMSDISIETFSMRSAPNPDCAISSATVADFPTEYPDDKVWLAPMR